jgi:hypothetical protein
VAAPSPEATASAVASATDAPVVSTRLAAAPPEAAVAGGFDVPKGRDAGKGRATPGAALKPASKHISGSNFALDVSTPGCRASEECAMTIKLVPGGEYHVNKEYPYKFIATPAPGVAFLGKADPNTFTKAAGDFVENGEKAATMTVRWSASSAGEAHVAGRYKLSVCSAAQCQIEEQLVDLAVPVM